MPVIGADFFLFWAVHRDFTQIYGQRAILGWFVRKQNAFYGQTIIFGDLSVNFWPLWWRFTDKAGFLEHLSVKPGPNRLNFYGQKAVFDHFVRNRHFSGRPFTDKLPIFIDLSVNGSDFEFVLLSRSRTLNLNQPVDKNHAFLPVFVYFQGRAGRFRSVR